MSVVCAFQTLNPPGDLMSPFLYHATNVEIFFLSSQVSSTQLTHSPTSQHLLLLST